MYTLERNRFVRRSDRNQVYDADAAAASTATVGAEEDTEDWSNE